MSVTVFCVAFIAIAGLTIREYTLARRRAEAQHDLAVIEARRERVHRRLRVYETAATSAVGLSALATMPRWRVYEVTATSAVGVSAICLVETTCTMSEVEEQHRAMWARLGVNVTISVRIVR